jgi:tyrosyl-tRNA synthetase
VVAGAKVLDVIVEHGLVPSKSEGRRVIEQRGVSIEGTVIESIDAEIAEGVCKVGKRKFLRITL